jgi:hypothetical protein
MAKHIATLTPGAGRGPGHVNPEAPTLLTRQFGLGGLKGRYAIDRGRLIRFVDPFTGVLLWHGDPLQYENWLLRRFDPSIATLDARRLEWSALHHGQLLTTRPSLHWAEPGVPGTLEIVVRAGHQPNARTLHTLDIVARAHGMKPSARTTAQIRSNTALLDTLDVARQRMVIHAQAVRDPALSQLVLDALIQASTPGQLLARLLAVRAATTACEVQALVFWLRQLRQVEVTLKGGRYDEDTVIQRL